jgi:copper chaperone CopZ
LNDGAFPCEVKKVRFSVSGINCLACSPAFRRGLARFEGIRSVKGLPMLDKVVVEFDPSKTNESRVRAEISIVAERSGFKRKVIFVV